MKKIVSWHLLQLTGLIVAGGYWMSTMLLAHSCRQSLRYFPNHTASCAQISSTQLTLNWLTAGKFKFALLSLNIAPKSWPQPAPTQFNSSSGGIRNKISNSVGCLSKAAVCQDTKNSSHLTSMAQALTRPLQLGLYWCWLQAFYKRSSCVRFGMKIDSFAFLFKNSIAFVGNSALATLL